MDYIRLSEAVKEATHFISEADHCSSNLKKVKETPQLQEIFIKMSNVRDQLTKQTTEKFNRGFLAQDIKTLNECIIVFFNLEILREQIQSKVN